MYLPSHSTPIPPFHFTPIPPLSFDTGTHWAYKATTRVGASVMSSYVAPLVFIFEVKHQQQR